MNKSDEYVSGVKAERVAVSGAGGKSGKYRICVG
jgi:hypothetical protein